MKVTARLFAGLRDQAKCERIVVDLAESATIDRLIHRLGDDSPQLRPLLTKSMTAIGLEFAGRETVLLPGQEVAILPPVSGG